MQNRFVVLSMKVSIRLWVSFLLCWSWVLKYIAIRLIIVFSTTFQSITFALQNHHRWDKQQRFIEHYEILYRDKKEKFFWESYVCNQFKTCIVIFEGLSQKKASCLPYEVSCAKVLHKGTSTSVCFNYFLLLSADNFFQALGIGTPHTAQGYLEFSFFVQGVIIL